MRSSSAVTITLPNGKIMDFTRGVTGAEIAAAIGPGLAKAALALELDGRLIDLFRPIETDGAVRILTRKDPEALEMIRHDAAHVLAMAVQALYPGTQVTIGPSIEDGFYYDFARNEPFTPEDLPKIEAKMHEIIAAALPTRREVWSRDAAIAHFRGIGETYKAELIESIPSSEEISIYFHGEWHDLCRGPHFASTAQIGEAFKLTKIAGAYWRGDARNAQLQRIYGTAWRDKKELDTYLTRIEEAEKRDHRKIGREMGLFHLQPEAQGSVFWHPNGYVLYNQMEAYIRRQLGRAGYVEVKTPQLMDSKFWEQSGHWGKYRENMFVVPDEVPSTDDEAPILSGKAELMALKPMNCPAHIQIFNQHIRSYRELPIRMAEFGCCHRNEPHGALHGLMRVRQMTQDDAHIFCREDQIQSETEHFVTLLYKIYRDMGFEEVVIRLATRPEKFGGTIERWEAAEKALGDALRATGYDFEVAHGEGAFYAPKLEFHLRDAIGRSWQVGTLQLDYVLPERLDATYIAEDGSRKYVVMLHRAILGSLERFIGMLIEHYAGKFPLWLAPVQAVVATIVSDAATYAEEVQSALTAAGLRSELDTSNETINYKVRRHSLAKVPYLLVAGRREAEERTLTLRQLGSNAQKVMSLNEALAMLKAEAVPPDLRQV
ncbi:MAG: threonine--tRNA ligase [Rhizomicrobium sp.]